MKRHALWMTSCLLFLTAAPSFGGNSTTHAGDDGETDLICGDDSPAGSPAESLEQGVADGRSPAHPPLWRWFPDAEADQPQGEVREEVIVLNEVPIIDGDTTCVRSSWFPDDEVLIPTATEPWSLVARAPGILADREPGNGAAAAPRFSGRGTRGEQNVVRLDGFEITDDSSGESSFDLGQLRFTKVEVASGGCAAGVAAPGYRIDLQARTGTSAWSGSGAYRGSGDSGLGDVGARSRRNRLRGFSAAEVELGGPVKTGHLWFWGVASQTESKRRVSGGQRVDSDLEHAAGKLEATTEDSHLIVSWHHGETVENGRGAGPDRASTATWDHDSSARLLRLEGDQVVTPNLVLSGGYGELERQLGDAPRGGLFGEVYTDTSGIARGTTFGHAGNRLTDEGHLQGEYFVAGRASHELETGVRWRRHVADGAWAGGDGMAVEAGDNIAFTAGKDVLALWRDSTGRTDLEHKSLWIQDDLRVGRLTLLLGARLDQQQGTSRVSATGVELDAAERADAEWRVFSPRIGFNWATETGRTLVRAGYGRFTSRLGAVMSSRLARGVPRVDLELFNDADGDLAVDPEEHASRVPWYGVRPDLFAADLRPEITDEAVLGIEHELRPRLVMGVTFTHRRSHDLHERRILVREASGPDSEGRPAVTGDWEPVGTLEGGIEIHDLRPHLELLPSGLWINGDLSQETMTASLIWRGRLSARWRTSGHLTRSSGHWRLGLEFRRFDDPTDTVGSGDNGGDRRIEVVAVDRLRAAEQAVDSRWSFHWGASVELPRAIGLGFAVNGQEGYPLPYYRRVARAGAGIARVQLTEDADSLRAPDVVTLDVRLAKTLELGNLNISLGLEAFNLLDVVLARRYALDLGVGRGGAVDEVMTPRVWRLGLRLGWR